MFKVYTRIFSDFFKDIFNIFKRKTTHDRTINVPKNMSYIED